jgi:hypothetical protein
MTLDAANDFLMGGGVASAKFTNIGDSVTGVICRQPEVQQQTDITTGEPKYWPDGKPRQQLQVQLQTDKRDPEITNDNGVRAIYIKANMQKAVKEAVLRSGAKGLEVGGTLTVTYTGDGTPSQRGMNAPKLYSASYIPAPAVAANEFLNQGDPAPATAPAPAPAPAPVPAGVGAAPTAAPNGVSPEALAALQQLTPEQRQALGLN